MAVTFGTVLARAETNVSGTSLSSGSTAAPASGDLLIVAVHSDRASGDVTSPTLSGTNGYNLTYTKIAELNPVGSSQGIALYGALGAGGAAGVLTVDYGANAQAGIAFSSWPASGTDVANGVAQTFVQAPTGSATATTAPSLTLAAAANSNNRPIAMFYNNGGEVQTPRTNWTEVDDWGTTARALETQYRGDAFETTASSSTGTNRNWWMIAAEIKAPAAAATTRAHLPLLGVS